MVQPETGGASGPGPAFRQFASIGDEIACATRCIKAWQERGDFLGDIAVICMNKDHGKRVALALQSLGIPHLLMFSISNSTCGLQRAAAETRSPNPSEGVRQNTR